METERNALRLGVRCLFSVSAYYTLGVTHVSPADMRSVMLVTTCRGLRHQEARRVQRASGWPEAKRLRSRKPPPPGSQLAQRASEQKLESMLVEGRTEAARQRFGGGFPKRDPEREKAQRQQRALGAPWVWESVGGGVEP